MQNFKKFFNYEKIRNIIWTGYNRGGGSAPPPPKEDKFSRNLSKSVM